MELIVIFNRAYFFQSWDPDRHLLLLIPCKICLHWYKRGQFPVKGIQKNVYSKVPSYIIYFFHTHIHTLTLLTVPPTVALIQRKSIRESLSSYVLWTSTHHTTRISAICYCCTVKCLSLDVYCHWWLVWRVDLEQLLATLSFSGYI